MSLKNIKKIYMIGIKGVGMTMLAQFLSAKGYEVSGSDVDEVFMTDVVLHDSGIKFHNGFTEKNIPANFELIIHSTAYNENNNAELALVKKQNKKIMTYAEALGAVFQDYFGIAVCGSHGKTTTTAWLAYVLKMTNQGPNAMIGARVPQLDGASIIGPSNYLIIEADEYQNKLKLFNPRAVLLNNIDYDHPDFFPTHNDYNQVFIDFIKKIPKSGWLVANFDDPVIRKIAPVNTLAKVISYAIDESADYVAYDIQQMGEGQYFKVKIGADNFAAEDDDPLLNTELGSFSIRLSGRHSIYNALAVIASAIELGVDLVDIRTYLGEFTGTARRMETMGKYNGALILDDYAHHPTEIKATLAGARQKYGNKKIRVVFHPHTFTRTKALLDDFAKSFNDADEVIVLDIYGSAREAQGGVHSKDLVEKIKQHETGNMQHVAHNKRQSIMHISSQSECEKYLRDTIERDEVIILMGAGDVFRIGEKLVK